MNKKTEEELRAGIRDVKDFPVKGIVFRDITTLLKNGELLRKSVDYMLEPFKEVKLDKIVGIESRGFVFGTAIAYKLNVGFVPIRKPGKLPAEKIRQEYQLEYGSDAMEIHTDAVNPGESVLIVDDLLATGGTSLAACGLIKKLGGNIAGLSFLVELSFLGGRKLIDKYDIHSLIQYDSE